MVLAESKGSGGNIVVTSSSNPFHEFYKIVNDSFTHISERFFGYSLIHAIYNECLFSGVTYTTLKTRKWNRLVLMFEILVVQ